MSDGDIGWCHDVNPDPMRTLKSILFVACLILAIAALCDPGAPVFAVEEIYGEVGSVYPPTHAIRGARAPRYISLQMKPSETLIAGETGRFELEARLKGPEGTPKETITWNRQAPVPLVVWIAAPDKSGIAFIDRANPERPRRHILVRFDLPPKDESQPLTALVEYTISSRTKAGEHDFWMDIYGELTGVGGKPIQDMGAVRWPFTVDTHIWTKLLMLALIGAAVFLFVVEWVRVDVVAIAMMVLLPELGLLDSHDTFKGLSSNAVVAIIGVMIISHGLNRAGLVSRMIQPLLKTIGKSSRRLTVIFSSLIAAISSVMQNTGAAVLFLPAVRLVATYRLKIPISRVLMPIGMAAILGGTLTMIGTSPLILLNDILPVGMAKFSFLELTPIGLALAAGGIAYLSTVGMRMLAVRGETPSEDPHGKSETNEEGLLSVYRLIQGPFEIHVPPDYQPGDRPQTLVEIHRRFLVTIVALAKGDGLYEVAPPPERSIQAGSILCAYGPLKAVRRFVGDYGLVLKKQPVHFRDTLCNPSVAGIVEGVVSPRSSLIGKTIRQVGFGQTFGLNPLAVHQSGRTHYQSMADRPLKAGDAVLMHGTWARLMSLKERHQDLIMISPFEEDFQKPEKAGRALVCFSTALAMMLLSSFYFQSQPYNPIPLSVCLMAGAVGMILTRVISISEAYRAVDWRTVFLLGGLIPLGMAMDQTGTAAWIAKGIVAGLGPIMSPMLLLILLAILSCGFTMVISNVGACTLLVPLGISIASQIGIEPRVAAIVVGLGVSNSFILPTHQVNALYMSAGGYRTQDYLRIGGGLALIYMAVLVGMTYFFYL
ncbi:MAG: SLC13 family permease [Candidatus Desulfacyla sp.]